MLKQMLQGVNITPCLSLKLIKPTCMYESEIWASNLITKKQPDKQNIWMYIELMHFEKLHLTFCMSILGVHYRAPNAADRLETDRYPLGVDMLVQMVKYILQITGNEYTNNILGEAFEESRELDLPERGDIMGRVHLECIAITWYFSE